MTFLNSLDFAKSLDETDPLRRFRFEFIIPPFKDGHAIYFLGNSLGLQPRRAATYISTVLRQWQQYGVEAFFIGDQSWLDYHAQLTTPLATIVGALPHEVVVMNQLTVNLHLMLVSFYQPAGRRTKILCEAKAFPSDQYMLETHVRQRGLDPKEHIIEVAPRAGEGTIHLHDVLKNMERYKDEIAMVLWGGVNYYTGQAFDMKAITAAAQQVGAMVGFDLAHAAGNVPLYLHNWNVDFACWCNYKYLNAGPGAVGAAFIHERHHHNETLNRFAGWWGYRADTRFQMKKGFEPVSTAEGWALSTPSPVLFASLRASLDLFDEAGIQAVMQKSQLLSDFLFFVLHEVLKKFDVPPFCILTPEEREGKGSQVSLVVAKNGKRVFEFLTANGIFADWREPDVIRIAPVPLYNTFEEVWRFGSVLEQALRSTHTNQ